MSPLALIRFNIWKIPATTPLDINKSLLKANLMNNDHMEDLKKIPYQAAVENLLYAAQTTQPDIGYPVNLLCQKPTKTQCIMHCLRGTTETTLTYSRHHGDGIVGYVDCN